MSTYNLKLSTQGNGTWDNGVGLTDQIAIGTAFPNLDLILAQAGPDVFQQYLANISVVAGAPLDLDLNGALVDDVGRTLSLTKLYFAVLALTTQDGTKSLQWGPQSVTNAAQLWFGAATGSSIVYTAEQQQNKYGWPIVAGTGDLLRIKNPGSGTVSGVVWLVGKQ